MTPLEADAARWLRAAAERVERGLLPAPALLVAVREFGDRLEAEIGPVDIDHGPGIGGVARDGWER